MLLTVVVVLISAVVRVAVPDNDGTLWKVADYAIFAATLAALLVVWERNGFSERRSRRPRRGR